jgi:prophage regulatory protein
MTRWQQPQKTASRGKSNMKNDRQVPTGGQYGQLLRVSDVIGRLRISKATLYRWLKEEQFPAPIRIGKMVRWLSDQVDAFVIEQSQRRPVLDGRMISASVKPVLPDVGTSLPPQL